MPWNRCYFIWLFVLWLKALKLQCLNTCVFNLKFWSRGVNYSTGYTVNLSTWLTLWHYCSTSTALTAVVPCQNIIWIHCIRNNTKLSSCQASTSPFNAPGEMVYLYVLLILVILEFGKVLVKSSVAFFKSSNCWFIFSCLALLEN